MHGGRPFARLAGMRILPLAFDIQGKPVLVVGTGDMADAKARLVTAAGGVPVRIQPDAAIEHAALPPARLAFVAVMDGPLAEAWAARLKSRGLMINVVDRPDLCDFQVPALVDRGAVSIAIATGGASASLAKALRERLEAWLPETLGELAETIARRRPEVARQATTVEARRAFWDKLLAPGGALDPLSGTADPNRAITEALSGKTGAATETLTLELASPNPDDLTLGQLRLLQRADYILHDPDVPPAVLDKARRDAVRIAVTGADLRAGTRSGVVLRLRLKTGADENRANGNRAD